VIDGLRQAYVDVGDKDAEPILLLHGQPSWSYLYRHMIPVLADAGYRVIAMDHLGMGRSDKPIDLEYHSYANHVYRLERFVQELELTNITAFVQDWGSLIGLNVVGNHPERFARVVVGDGTVQTASPPSCVASAARWPRMGRRRVRPSLSTATSCCSMLVTMR
jgi:pimeloyl-ACP methyl ester carboxylesterase